MKTHNFIVPIVDTDSITICKPDGGEFTETEIQALTDEINGLGEELINWDLEFYIPKVVVAKSKNYILWDGKKKKIKGSSFKASQKEPAIIELIHKVIDLFISDETDKIVPLYETYVKEALAIQDISRWASKRTLTETVLKSQRANETKLLDALKGQDFQVGDKILIYYTPDGTMKTTNNWTNDHDIRKMLKRLYDTMGLFEKILDMETVVNYSLKTMALRLEHFDEIVAAKAKGGKVVKVKSKRSNHDFMIEYPNDA